VEDLIPNLTGFTVMSAWGRSSRLIGSNFNWIGGKQATGSFHRPFSFLRPPIIPAWLRSSAPFEIEFFSRSQSGTFQPALALQPRSSSSRYPAIRTVSFEPPGIQLLVH
jgi:hypothetical protein